jgi:hypothetical protein
MHRIAAPDLKLMIPKFKPHRIQSANVGESAPEDERGETLAEIGPEMSASLSE